MKVSITTVQPLFLLVLISKPRPISQKRCLIPFSKWKTKDKVNPNINIFPKILSKNHWAVLYDFGPDAIEMNHYDIMSVPIPNPTPVILCNIDNIMEICHRYIERWGESGLVFSIFYFCPLKKTIYF